MYHATRSGSPHNDCECMYMYVYTTAVFESLCLCNALSSSLDEHLHTSSNCSVVEKFLVHERTSRDSLHCPPIVTLLTGGIGTAELWGGEGERGGREERGERRSDRGGGGRG